MLARRADQATASLRRVACALLLSLAVAAPTRAQNPGERTTEPPGGSTGGDASKKAAAAPICTRDTTTPRVDSAYRVTNSSVDRAEAAEDSRNVKLRDYLAVQVTNLGALLDQQRCATKDDGKPRKIVLYLDDEPVPDLSPYPPLDPQKGLVVFRLMRSDKSRDLWTALLGKPTWDPRPTRVSLGLEDRWAIESRASILLAVLQHGWTYFWGLVFVVLLVLFFLLAKRSGMIRDDTPEPGGAFKRPYSLARLQAAWWFFVIVAAYLFIGMITGDWSTSLTGTVLVLLGLSAGTALGSALIDGSKDTPGAAAQGAATLAAVDARLAAIDVALKGNPAANLLPAPADQAATLTAERESLKSQRRKLRNESEDFLKDILSDANGVNFHRFQMAAWTLVLSIVFVVEVYREIAMPQFGATLLGLMGISSGTFLGLKGAEPTVPKP